eukprot:jgi/Bigna1/88084/estExt_fgenesh1_pg.C_280011
MLATPRMGGRVSCSGRHNASWIFLFVALGAALMIFVPMARTSLTSLAPAEPLSDSFSGQVSLLTEQRLSNSTRGKNASAAQATTSKASNNYGQDLQLRQMAQVDDEYSQERASNDNDAAAAQQEAGYYASPTSRTSGSSSSSSSGSAYNAQQRGSTSSSSSTGTNRKNSSGGGGRMSSASSPSYSGGPASSSSSLQTPQQQSSSSSYPAGGGAGSTYTTPQEEQGYGGSPAAVAAAWVMMHAQRSARRSTPTAPFQRESARRRAVTKHRRYVGAVAWKTIVRGRSRRLSCFPALIDFIP